MASHLENVLLQTERLLLRPWRVQDAQWYIDARDEEIFRWTTEKRELTIEEMKTAIEQTHKQNQAICLAITDIRDGSLLGNLALLLDENGQQGEIMYWLASHGRGRGIATEAVKLLSHWALTKGGLKRIQLKTLLANAASQHVAERAGYQQGKQTKDETDAWLWYELVQSNLKSM